MGSLKPKRVDEEYVFSRYRSSRDERGNLTFVSGLDQVKLIAELEVVDVISGERRKVGTLHT